MSNRTIMGDLLKTYKGDRDTIVNNIFSAQRAFGGKFIPFDEIRAGVKEGNLELHDWWKAELCLCCLDELSEVLGWISWKHWKHYPEMTFDLNEIRFEMIDLLHFVVNMLLVSGVEPTSHMFDTDTGRYPISATNPDTDPAALVSETKKWVLRFDQTLGSIIEFPRDLAPLYHLLDNLTDGFSLVGMTLEDVYSYYMSKNKENFDRQARGY